MTTVTDYARLAYESYRDSTGGLTYDSRPMPTWDQIVERTPHVARAWRDAANAVLDAEAHERLKAK